MPQLLRHTIFWLVYTAYAMGTVYVRFPRLDKLDFVLYQGLLICVFYLVVYVLHKFRKANIPIRVLSIVVVFILFCLVRYLYRYAFLPAIGHTKFFIPFEIKEYLSDTLLNFIEYLLYAIGYWFTIKSYLADATISTLSREKLTAEKQILQLQAENLELQNAKLTAEYNHLKAQVNPHFLFNTLNTFYSSTEPVLPDTAKGIMLLSDIMRYSLETGGHDGKVSLNDELVHLKYYIDLMQLRFDNALLIKGNLFANGALNQVEGAEQWRILPHLLITIAENAFKHGSNEYPFEINLSLSGQQLHFVFKNTAGMRKSVQGTGIGISNMIQRLKFTYGTEARFAASVNGSQYVAELFINEKSVSLNQPINKAS